MANRQRLSRWSQNLASFAFSSVAGQVLSALSGVVIIRALDKTGYAWFTIASGISAALNILSDAGLAGAVTAIGGRVWNDPGHLAVLVARALRWRTLMTWMAILVTVPSSIFLLLRAQCPLPTAILLTGLTILPVSQSAVVSIYTVVNRLHARSRQLQLAEISTVLVRIAGIAALAVGHWLTAASALFVSVVSIFSQFIMVRRQVLPLLLHPSSTVPVPVEIFDVELKKTIKHIYPNAAFACIQAQLGVWLISTFASTSEVADFGALSRLAIIFAAFNGPLVHAICPAFARSPNSPRRLIFILLGSCGLVALLSSLLLLFAATFPQVLLTILGSQYANLENELLWVIGMMGTVTFMQTIWHLNVTRGWVASLSWNIPLVIAVQTTTFLLLPIDTIPGIALMSIIVATVQTVHAAIISIRGIRATAAPFS